MDGSDDRATEQVWLADTLTDDQFRTLEHTICCHVSDDHLAPEMTPELACLKDVDGLDRLRIGELDVRCLRTPASRSLVKGCKPGPRDLAARA